MALTVAICVVLFTVWVVLSRKRPRTALATLPAAVVLIIFGGILSSINGRDDPMPFVFSLFWAAGTVIICLLILARTPFDLATGQFPWPRTWAKWILIVLGYLLLLTSLLAIFNLFGLILFVLFVAGAFRFQKSLRYASVLEVVSVLSHCVRQNLPLPMALHTAAQYRPDSGNARVLESVSHWLVQGLPLGRAVRSGWPRAPEEVITTIEAAQKISQLPQALESLEKDIAEKSEDFRKVRPVHPVYPLTVLGIAFLLILGLCIFIVPTFAEVLSDMSDGRAFLPQPTRMLLDLSNYLTSSYGLPTILIVLGVIILYKFIALLWASPRRSGSRMTSLGDCLKWRLPLQCWFERRYSQLRLIEYLRAAFRAGRPVNEALRDALALDMNGCYRQCVRRWLERIERGEPLGQAARRAGMGSTMAWAFDEGLNRQNLPEILEMLEETTRVSYNYLANILRSILWPLVIVGVGMAVGFFVYAFFVPMVQIIYVTMEYTMP